MAFLVGAYILIIGPGDFWLLKRLVRRTEFTWLTFPLIVIGLSAAAYAIANYLKGDELRVNQVEIVDIDCSDADATNDLVRGTVWTHFFTPEVSQFDLQFSSDDPRPGRFPTTANRSSPGWAFPATRLGGMQADASQTAVFDQGYRYDEQLAAIEQLPVPVWSTKTLTSRWTAAVESDVSAPSCNATAENYSPASFPTTPKSSWKTAC